MEKKITVIKGDGIGPEIVTEAQKVLDKVAEKFGHKFVYTDILMGGCSIDKYGVPLTDEAVEIAKAYDDSKAPSFINGILNAIAKSARDKAAEESTAAPEAQASGDGE